MSAASLHRHPHAAAIMQQFEEAVGHNSEHETREAWLNAFAREAAPHFEEAGFPLPPNVRISIGFPSAGAKGKAIGECWSSVASRDGHFEIFLKPTLETDSRIADVLTHELVHAAVGLEHKHDRVFKRCATALGLEGKMTATVAGDQWRAWAEPVLAKLGPMPGAPLANMTTGKKKQTTRLIKCECDTCGFVFRATRQWILDAMRCPDPDCDGKVES